MIPGWRARIHYWSHHSGFLKRLAVSIVAVGFFGALIIIALSPDPSRFASTDPVEQSLRQEWQKLSRAKEPMPYELVRWLDKVTDNIQYLGEVLETKVTTWEDYQAYGLLAGYDTRPLLAQHSKDPATVQLWQDFIQAELTRDAALFQSLADRAAQESPLMTANLIQAYQMQERAPPIALASLMREATLFPQASQVRESALHLAIRLQDVPVLRQIAAQPEWWSAMPAGLRHQAAMEMQDFGLQWESLLEYRSLLAAPLGTLAVAVLAALIWYVILVMHGVRGRWRWVAPLLPLMAGIFSVWPVFLADSWQEMALGMKEDAPFPYDLWYQIGGVGMREELSKLLLASLFMPWLLYERPAGGALMIGAFVGLGFALEENINYYLEYEGGVAVVRFFSANFFHAAMTGLTTHALYGLLSSRFGSADVFLATFLGVVAAHGTYNFLHGGIEDGSFFATMVLALVSWRFLDLVQHECPRVGRQHISPAAVFLIGTALLMAVVFLSLAIRTPDRQLLVKAATGSISILPLAFIYWRRLGV